MSPERKNPSDGFAGKENAGKVPQFKCGAWVKAHALGNDYIVINPSAIAFPLTEKNVSLICSRNKGVGADGVLYGPFYKNGDIPFVRIFNSDGSEAEKSGNGIRIFAKYLYSRGMTCGPSFPIDTLSGRVSVSVEGGAMVSADMGTVSFKASDIPFAGPEREVVSETLAAGGREYTVTSLSIGIPHCILFCPEISKELACSVGPLIERHEVFPRKTNVQFAKVVARDKIEIMIWERGSGYTMASGSSACSAACAGYKLGLTDRNVSVAMPGGTVSVSIDEGGRVHLRGPVQEIFEGSFTPEFEKLLT
ncbi:MAG: diaminopimelate epimerase [Elusimicrobiaceae bacterium]